jgi:hypothetical protein
LADSLIQDPTISKIVLSNSSKKLVDQAQAVIVYFEGENDLKKMSKLIKIYSGVPLRVYVGPERIKNFQNFYKFDQSKEMIEDLKAKHERLAKNALDIYQNILKDSSKKHLPLTVKEMIRGIK